MNGHLSNIGYDQAKHDAEIERLRRRNLFTIHDVVLAMVEIYELLYDQNAYSINCGNCEEFARDVVDVLGDNVPGLTTFWDDELDESSDGRHCFIMLGNRYYDSQTPGGVENWKELPLFGE